MPARRALTSDGVRLAARVVSTYYWAVSRLPASKRREQLLDRAAELFAKNGYARATTAQLAKAAGVTEPIIYRHFDSKRDLFVALIERTGRETIERWEEDLAGANDPAERLRRLL